jgi:DNA end-binding protein Ku
MASRGRDYVVAIKPCGDGLLLETLRYADEIRESELIFSGIEEVDYEDEMQSLATELIERKSAPFDASAFKSQYATALRELIEEKRKAGKTASASEDELTSRSDNVVDLMDALKKSLKSGKKSTGKKKTTRKKSTAKKSGSKKSSSKTSRRKAS